MSALRYTVLICGLQLACGGKTEEQVVAGNGTDSNTHWLSHCELDAQCPDAMQCLCGVCSQACDDGQGCDDLDSAALCLELRCGQQDEPAAVCSKACDRDADCGTGTRCETGACIPDAGSVASGDGGAQTAGNDTQSSQTAGNDTQTSQTDTESPTGSSSELDAGPHGVCEQVLQQVNDGPIDCGEQSALCDQMRADGSEHTFVCVFLEDLPGPELVSHQQCLADRLGELGAGNVTQADGGVFAVGDFEQLAAVAGIANVRCTPGCGEGECAHCYDLPEAECGTDAFCTAALAVPVDTAGACLQTARFATCRPMGVSCDDALTTATDASGQCWYFSSICYDRGFDYDVADPACSYDLPQCAATTPTRAGCEAMDAAASEDNCDAESSYAWDGQRCREISCACVGDACSFTTDSLSACQARWAGCADDLSECIEEQVPSTTDGGFVNGSLVVQAGEEFSEWTTAVWNGPIELPISFVACNPVEGLQGPACAVPRGIKLLRDDEEVLRVDAGLWQWGVLPNYDGRSIEFRVRHNELSVRDIETQLPLLFLSLDSPDDEAAPAWNIPPFSFAAGQPHCTRNRDDCGLLEVVQRLDVSMPGQSADMPSQQFVLEPFHEREVSFDTDAGTQRYSVGFGASVYAGDADPGGPECDIARPRRDNISLVRLDD